MDSVQKSHELLELFITLKHDNVRSKWEKEVKKERKKAEKLLRDKEKAAEKLLEEQKKAFKKLEEEWKIIKAKIKKIEEKERIILYASEKSYLVDLISLASRTPTEEAFSSLVGLPEDEIVNIINKAIR